MQIADAAMGKGTVLFQLVEEKGRRPLVYFCYMDFTTSEPYCAMIGIANKLNMGGPENMDFAIIEIAEDHEFAVTQQYWNSEGYDQRGKPIPISQQLEDEFIREWKRLDPRKMEMTT